MKSFFQTDPWAKFKEQSGWQAQRYDGLLGLRRELPFGQAMLYFPEVSVDVRSAEALTKVIAQIDRTKQTFIRFEFLGLWEPELASVLLNVGLIKSFEEVQPEYRQWVGLESSEAKILEQMKPKGRYNIRVAERHHLEIERGTSDDLVRRFFALYQTTSKRSDFSGRGLAYFQQLMQVLAKEKVGEIILVKKHAQDLSAAIMLYYDEIASYLYGGSGGDRALMAPYLMHWEAIKSAKKRKMRIYDLLAVAPPDEPNHPYAGLTRFKTQFGGQTVRMLGGWDLVCRPFWYTMYRFAERRRRGNL